jgi:hypothetical protein
MDEEEETLLEAYILGLLVSLLDHHLKDDEYKSAFVSATAVMGVDGDRRWKDPLAYTPIISAIVTIARMLVLYTAVKTRQDRVTEIIEKEGFPYLDAEEVAASYFDLV